MEKISNKYRTGFVCSVLIIISLAVFLQVRNFDFLNYDDNRYITENSHVYTGLNFDNYRWAFIAPHFFMWHPMTSLSHMLDCQLFGLNPGWHHIVSLLFHIANALLLFTILRKMTGVFWSSAFVAALFVVHPLNVESVAWVAERKTVLSAFFSFLTIAAYIRYVKRPQMLNYLLVVFIFALAVMSKPTTVTLPFVLLLLDYWPLKRIRGPAYAKATAGGQNTEDRIQRTEDDASQKLSTRQLIKEKIPLLLLSLALCALTVIAQQSGKVLKLNEDFPFGVRLANALVSYVSYIGNMFYPADLAIFYPHPGFNISLWISVVSFLLLVIISSAVIYPGRHKGYLVVGWLWFLGTLVPMIGLVQAGGQARADRYSYFSLIGLFIIAAFCAEDLLGKYRFRKIILGVLSAIVISVLSVCAFFQTGYWRNSQTLFEHALKVTTGNYVAYSNLGAAYIRVGLYEKAEEALKEAIRIVPGYADPQSNLGAVYGELGRYADAIEAFEQAIRFNPDLADAHNNLGVIYGKLDDHDKAIEACKEAIRIKPDYAEAYNNLGSTLDKLGRYEEAIEAYIGAVKSKPDYAEAYNQLGGDLGRLGQYPKAIEAFNEAIRIDTDYIDAYNNLGTTYNRLGRLQEAMQVFGQAIKVQPKDPRAYYGLGLVYIKAGDINSAKKQHEILKTLDTKQAEQLLGLIQKYDKKVKN